MLIWLWPPSASPVSHEDYDDCMIDIQPSCRYLIYLKSTVNLKSYNWQAKYTCVIIKYCS